MTDSLYTVTRHARRWHAAIVERPRRTDRVPALRPSRALCALRADPAIRPERGPARRADGFGGLRSAQGLQRAMRSAVHGPGSASI
jgi:hypothetical protein